MKNQNRFATHPIFDIDGLDWLCEHLSTAPAKVFDDFNAPAKSDSDYSAWQERCACIGMMTPPARALCSLLVWGNDKRAFDVVLEYLTNQVLMELKEKQLPKGCVHDRADLAGRMAYMVWHLYLWNMWDLCTTKGRLYFAGIEMNVGTYSNQFASCHKTLLEAIQALVVEIEHSISEYRHQLKQQAG